MDAQVIVSGAVEASGRLDGRKRRRAGAGPERRAEVERVKTTVTLSREQWRRLQHHAVEEDCDPCVLVGRLIDAGLRSVRVQRIEQEPARQPVAVA
jgi:hypothetical protein